MRKVGLLIGLLSVACHDISELPLEDLSTAGAAVFVAIDVEGRASSAFAYDPTTGPPPPISLATDDQLVAFLFESSLDALDLREGPFNAGAIDSGREMPPGFDAWRANGIDRVWTPVDSASARMFLGDFRLPARSPGSCASGGGCFVRRDGIAYCETPCPSLPPIDPPAEVEGAEPPVMTPCPGAWSETTTPDDVTICLPEVPTVCPDGQAKFLGDSACDNLGARCPAGGWPVSLPTDRPIAYVRPGGGDLAAGTMLDPFGSIQAAVDAHPTGAIVALAPGTFDADLVLSGNYDIVGTCSAATAIRSTSPRTIRLATGRLRIANVRIEVDALGIEATNAATDLFIEGVAFSGGTRAISTRAARTNLEDITAVNGTIELYGPAATVQRVNVIAATDVGIALRGTTVTASISNTYVGDVVLVSRGSGFGIFAGNGARVRLDASMVEGSPRNDIAFWDGASLIARDVVVRGRPEVRGLNALDIKDAEATIENLYVTGKGSSALWQFGASDVRLQDAVVHDNGPCVFSNMNSRTRIDHLDCRRVSKIGIILKQSALSNLSHVFIRDVAVDANGELGEGLLIEHHRSTGDHVVIEEATNFGMTLLANKENPAHAAYSHVTVRNTHERTSRGGKPGTFGVGLGVRAHTSVEMDHVLLEGNQGEGLTVQTLVDPPNNFEDLTIRGNNGGALFLDGHVIATRMRLADNRSIALDIFGTRVDAQHVAIQSSRETGINLLGRATMIDDFMEADLNLTHFELVGHDIAIKVRRFAQFRLDDGAIRDDTIGIRIEQVGYDLERIGPTVIFDGNRENIVVQ